MKPFNFSKLLRNSFIQGGTIFVIANFVVGFLNYLFNVLAGRALGPEDYGEIVAMYSYVIILSIPTGVLGAVLIQKIGASTYPEELIASWSGWIGEKLRRLWWMVVLPVLLIPVLPFVANISPVTSSVLIGLVLIGYGTFFFSTTLQGLHRFIPFAGISIIATIIKLIGPAIVFFFVGDIYMVFIAIILSSLFQLGASWLYVRRSIVRSSAPTPQISMRIRSIFLKKELWYSAGVTVVLILLNNLDIVVAKRILPAHEAGYFGAWALFGKIYLYLVGPLLSLAYIFLTKHAYRRFHQPVVMLASIFLLGGGLFVTELYRSYGRTIIELIFGQTYNPILPFLVWGGYFGTGYVLMMFFMNYFLAKKSPATLIPAIIYPIYGGALLFMARTIGDIIFMDIVFVYLSIGLYLIVFFKDRLQYLIQLFRK